MSYGYNSRTAFSKAVTDINDEAAMLLDRLNGERQNEDQKTRPIIFVSHSLGGIVVKKALILAHERSRHYLDLLNSVRGLVFFGVPHRGSDIAYWGTFAANLLKVTQLGFGTNNSFVEALRRNSATFADISRQFIERGANLPIRTFFETEKLLNELIVDNDSARLNLPNEIAVGVVGANHKSICKFRRADNQKYSPVWRAVKNLVDSALVESIALSANSSDQISPSRESCFSVPFERDLKFIGREDIIAEIDKRLEVQRRVALAGIGGVGKSQIAIEYCYRFRDQYPESHVFWIHASTVSRMDQGYKDIARKLRMPGWNAQNVDRFQLVSEYLNDEVHGPWLLVLDNADDLETFFSAKSDLSSVGSKQTAPLVNYLPRSSNGSTLITTRDKRVGERLANREKAIVVLPMAVLEAEGLLWSKVGQEGSLDKAKASELLEVLGYLPLAITQAAAYISENNTTIEEYLEAFSAEDSEMQDLLSEDLPDLRRDFESQTSVVRTWKVSFDQIREQKPRAAEILSLMACFDRQGIPKALLHRDGERGNEFTTALGALQAFSLVAVEKGGTSFEIHRLAKVSTQRWLELQGETTKWREEALKVLTAAFPSADYSTWVTCEVLSPRVQTVTRYAFTSDLSLLQRAQLLYRMSSYDHTQGRYNLAYERGLDSLSTREKMLGPEHPDTLNGMNIVAVALDSQGKYKAAEEMHRQALELRRKVLGPEHPGTLTSMNDLAGVLSNQGKYKAAEEMHRQALELREKALGPEHPYILVSVNNLAIVLGSQGKFEEAEEMHRQALELKEKMLSPEHPSTLTSMRNLAGVLDRLGKFKEAEEMLRRVLQLTEKVLGPEHPDTVGIESFRLS
ncbi:MAG: hypothetical protein M1839_005011 [Geoglossum umbratile]|nr:MAG: hypothetical protein M1839_005011 [Geoglossum umbratile]